MTIAVRQDVFDRIDAIAPTLQGDVEAAEAQRRLPASTLDAFRAARLLWLKVPAEIGGYEVEPALQFEVFERVAASSLAAAWCLFIYADTAGMITSRVSGEGLALYLDEQGEIPVTAGGGGLRAGRMKPVGGGYSLSGDWRYGSGITGADWVMVSGLLAQDGGRGRLLQCVVSSKDLDVKDNWHVLGLKGTGSSDFSAQDVFVPEALTYSPLGPAARGGRQYRTATVGFLAYTIPAVVNGVARRVLNELTTAAATTKRGYARPRPIAEGATFQHFLGEADQKLRAAKALMLASGIALMEAVDAQGHTTPAQEAETRAAAAFATKMAVDVVHDVARFAGGGALRMGQTLEQALRDVTMASTHVLVGESAFENHGQFQLGIPGADPMA